MPNPRKNQRLRLAIDSLSNDGSGVGRHEGMVVFVPGAAVGDVLDVQLVKLQKSHAYGIIRQIVTPGAGRVTPDCPVAGKCGGCAFRHLTYAAELEAKRGFVADALRRVGGIDFEVPACLPSPNVARYRNKVQYPVAAGAGGGLLYGFYAPRSHRPVPCADCLLQPAELNEMAAAAARLLAERGVAAYDETKRTGLVRHLYLRQSTATGKVLLCPVLTTDALPDAEGFAEAMRRRFPALAGVVLNVNAASTNVILGSGGRLIWGEATLADSLCGVPMRLGIHSFAQVNHPGAARLFALAAEYAAPAPGDTLLDLYCGTGVIGLSMTAACKQLIGVELVEEALEAARLSAREMGLGNTRFIRADAAEAAQKLAAEGLRPDIVTLDPPRKGAGPAALNAVLAMAPKRVVMISCNPATLARDLAHLATGGYGLQSLQPADLFPRTKHVECVALLKK